MTQKTDQLTPPLTGYTTAQCSRPCETMEFTCPLIKQTAHDVRDSNAATTTKFRVVMQAWLVLFLLIGTASIGLAADATFSWLPNLESNLAGYRIYYGQSSREYNSSIDVAIPPTGIDGRVHYTVTGLTPGVTYYFAATAYDTDGQESGYSAEVVWTVPTDINSDGTGGGNTGDSNTPPTAVISANLISGKAPLKVNFDGSASTDQENDRLSYIWNFGDGSSATTATAYISHIYTTTGTYTASLKVDDGTDSSVTVVLHITVTPGSSGGSGTSPPIAVINVETKTGIAPFTVSFDASNSTSSTTNGSIVQYAWNFGDGKTSSAVAPQHTFAAAGTYTVTLTVTDDTAAQAETSIAITATTGGSNPTHSSSTGSQKHQKSPTPNLLPIYQLLLLK